MPGSNANAGVNLHNLEVCNDFLDMTLKAQATKEIDKFYFIKIKSLHTGGKNV